MDRVQAITQDREMHDVSALLNLPLTRYRLRFDAGGAWRGAPESAWRGALGHALRKRVCVTRREACTDCLLAADCAFPLFFPAALPQRAERVEDTRITPYVLAASPADEAPAIVCTLIGPALAHTAAILGSLADAAASGVGPGRGRLSLADIAQELPVGSNCWSSTLSPSSSCLPIPPAVPPCVRLRFDTPLRLRRDNHCITPAMLTFADLFTSLLRRASALHAQSTGTVVSRDYRALVLAAREVRWKSTHLQWQESTRRSERQQATMVLGGIVGDAALSGADAQPFWPLLWLGQWLHAGKNASFGFGGFRLLGSAAIDCPGHEPALPR